LTTPAAPPGAVLISPLDGAVYLRALARLTGNGYLNGRLVESPSAADPAIVDALYS